MELARALLLGIPQVLIWGTQEDFVPRPLVESYARAAARAGDSVPLLVIPGVGHFETASPLASTWPEVKAAITGLLDGRLPSNQARGQPSGTR